MYQKYGQENIELISASGFSIQKRMRGLFFVQPCRLRRYLSKCLCRGSASARSSWLVTEKLFFRSSTREFMSHWEVVDRAIERAFRCTLGCLSALVSLSGRSTGMGCV